MKNPIIYINYTNFFHTMKTPMIYVNITILYQVLQGAGFKDLYIYYILYNKMYNIPLTITIP